MSFPTSTSTSTLHQHQERKDKFSNLTMLHLEENGGGQQSKYKKFRHPNEECCWHLGRNCFYSNTTNTNNKRFTQKDKNNNNFGQRGGEENTFLFPFPISSSSSSMSTKDFYSFWKWKPTANEDEEVGNAFPNGVCSSVKHLKRQNDISWKDAANSRLKKPQQIVLDVCIGLLKAICHQKIDDVWNCISRQLLERQIISLLSRTCTSYSALLICIIYLVRFKNSRIVPLSHHHSMELERNSNNHHSVELARNPFLLFSISLLLSLKFITDRHICNKRWISYCGFEGGEQVCQVNAAEQQFLWTISYDLYIEPQLVSQLAEMIIGNRRL